MEGIERGERVVAVEFEHAAVKLIRAGLRLHQYLRSTASEFRRCTVGDDLERGLGFGQQKETFSIYWPANLHLVGKEIVRFHTVYWPAFLIAGGLPVPERVFGHGFWLISGEKMSKSRGNVVDPFVLNEVFGSELLRYYLLREMVFGQDCNFSYDAIVQRWNSDLANDLGNFRTRRGQQLIATEAVL